MSTLADPICSICKKPVVYRDPDWIVTATKHVVLAEDCHQVYAERSWLAGKRFEAAA